MNFLTSTWIKPDLQPVSSNEDELIIIIGVIEKISR